MIASGNLPHTMYRENSDKGHIDDPEYYRIVIQSYCVDGATIGAAIFGPTSKKLPKKYRAKLPKVGKKNHYYENYYLSQLKPVVLM